VNDTTIKPAPVRRSIEVNASPAKAFDVFTAGMGRWWLPTHKLGKTPFKEVVIEPRAGGRWFERSEDGSEWNWGKVLVWEPPARLVLAWQVDANFVYQPCLTTELEIRFIADEAGGTRVELEHRNLDRYGPQEQSVRAVFESPNGWSGLLAQFKARAEA
jgi:uncharacterized protein YndB with AHSA1/START domain